MSPRSRDAPTPLVQRIGIPSSFSCSLQNLLPGDESVPSEVLLRTGEMRRSDDVGFDDGVGETVDHGIDSEGEDWDKSDESATRCAGRRERAGGRTDDAGGNER